MAVGSDELLEFLLAGIAFCGDQGASSADFQRILKDYYQQSNSGKDAAASKKSSHPTELGGSFREQIWLWVVEHPDVRILYQGEAQSLSLPEFEALEIREGEQPSRKSSGNPKQNDVSDIPNTDDHASTLPSAALRSLSRSLREQMLYEGASADQPTSRPEPVESDPAIPLQVARVRGLRKLPKKAEVSAPVFEKPLQSLKPPRVFASQDRMWKALTGHSMDVKKVPILEYRLLSLIATCGAQGITQPALQKLSGQDKRSVPHRTSELARKGYIQKTPLQIAKAKTSLCKHRTFIDERGLLAEPRSIDDVFGAHTFDLPGFLWYLNKLLQSTSVVQVRNLRETMGITVERWNGRAVRSALRRLEQTHFIKRFLVKKRKKDPKAPEHHIVCIKALREATEDDINNLRFKGVASEPSHLDKEPLDEDHEEDGLTREMELDLADDVGSGDDETDERIPPQWTPDRMIQNLIFNATEMAGVEGLDAEKLRGLTTGGFWKRPIESAISRITDGWELSQPPHVRHLAIVRDTSVTKEKRRVFYVYRTYENFQKAVDAGEVTWEALGKNITSGGADGSANLDGWGFAVLNEKEFHRRSGLSSLAEAGSAITRIKRQPRDWEGIMLKEREPGTPSSMPRYKSSTPHLNAVEGAGALSKSLGHSPKVPKTPKLARPLLTKEERIKLGLAPRGRLGADIEGQIRAHRAKTGDENSIPNKLIKGWNIEEPKSQRYARRPGPPLLTREQRKARGLPENGRLSFAVTSEILREQGRNESLTHTKKSRNSTQPEAHPSLGDEHPNSTEAQYSALISSEKSMSDASLPYDEVSNERKEFELRDTQSATVLDMTVNSHSVAPQSPDATSVSVLTPLKKRKYQKQSKENDEFQNERSTKKARPNDSVPDVEFTGPFLSSGQSSGPVTSDAPSLTVISNPDQNGHTSDLDKDVATVVASGAVIGVQAQTPKLMQKATKSIRNKTTLTSHGPTIKTTCTNRLTTGLYLDPAATRSSSGRGRPKKAFLAIFKLPNLRRQVWFENDTLENEDRSPTPARHPVIGSKRPPAPQPAATTIRTSSSLDSLQRENFESISEVMNDVTGMNASHDNVSTTPAVAAAESGHEMPSEPEGVSSNNKAEAGTTPGSPSTRIETGSQTEVGEPVQILTAGFQAGEYGQGPNSIHASVEQTQLLDDYHEQLLPPTTGNPTNSNSMKLSDETDHRRHTSTSGSGPPVWPAVNLRRLTNSSPYRSPYSPAAQSPPASVASTNMESPSDVTVNGFSAETESHPTSNVIETPKKAAVPNASIALEDRTQAPAVVPPKSHTSQRVLNGRGVVLGKGSVSHSRAAVIRHIIDLCGGVFPANGELYSIFDSVWEEIGPKKIICPNQATLRKALSEMIQPDGDLQKMHFRVPGSGLAGNTNKAIYAYKGLTLTSEPVRKLMTGIIESYPHRYLPEAVRRYWKEAEKPVFKLPEVEHSLADDSSAPTVLKLEERIRKAKEERQKLAREIKSAQEEQKRRAKEAERERKRAAKEAEKERRKAKKEQESHEKEARDSPERPASSHRQVSRWRERLTGLSEGIRSVGGKTSKNLLSGASEPHAGATWPKSLENQGKTHAKTASIVEQPASQNPQVSEAQSLDELSLGFNWVLAALMSPAILCHSTTHTFSTMFTIGTMPQPGSQTKDVRKRVRSDKPEHGTPRKKLKKARPNSSKVAKKMEEFLLLHKDNSDDSSDEEDRNSKSSDSFSPTIVERLAGLTGDPNEPDYEPVPKRRRDLRTWSERKPNTRKDRMRRKYNAVKDRTYPEVFDPLAEFRKLSFALVIVSTMTGDDKKMDWSIISKIYAEDLRLDLKKVKKMWAWMQRRMSSQLQSIAESFQSSFLDAYEAGHVDPIEDLMTYDWAKLVRWALLNCSYQEPPLPFARQALQDCQFDVASNEILDRSIWYNTTLTSVNREERFAKYAFVSPLHSKKVSPKSKDDYTVKARALIRTNTSTPKELYDKNVAHDKLRQIPKPLLETTVADLERASMIRMRKIKRLKPGRNYMFAPHFAKHYRRTMELSDFMTAVQLKKSLDKAFVDPDPEKRVYLISRTAESGTVMAAMSLASEGRVRLVPKLPPIKNEFGAPLPRISVWGYSEGDYVHRLMDRQRLFWPIEVLPTADYEFGNPLRPVSSDRVLKENGVPAEWAPLAEPPLPGRDSSGALLLPIWSTIDGQSTIYPWWNRILSIVTQSLLFQPSNTAQEIFDRCEPYTTEVFEIQLVLDWLVSVNAASRSHHETYSLRSCHWAVFGDHLIDEERDDFGEHVKRNPTNKKLVPTWRTEFNNRYSNLQQGGAQGQSSKMAQGAQIGKQIAANPNGQYRLARKVLDAVANGRRPTVSSTPALTPDATSADASEDVEMVEADADAEGEDLDAEGEDVDAEGESDDEYL